ncbi:hypothetical protein D3C71_1393030 [compost metagenome]
MEFIDGSDIRVLPQCAASLSQSSTELAAAARTVKEQGSCLGTGRDDRPARLDLPIIQSGRFIAVIGVGIMGFDPGDELGRANVVRIVGQSRVGVGRRAEAYRIADIMAVVGSCKIDIVGVIRKTVRPALQNFPVDVQVRTVVQRTQYPGPEVGASGIVRQLDMLGGVEPEAVGTERDSIIQERDDHVLQILIAGVQVGKADAPLGNLPAIIVIANTFGFMPEARIVPHNRIDIGCRRIGQAAAACIGGMIGNHIHDNADAVFVGFRAQLLELVTGAKLRVAYREISRLIEQPPLASLRRRLLRGLDRRSLNRLEARGCYCRKIIFNIVE